MIVLNMDCRHGLAMMPDNSVDAIVCDPPYGLGKEPDVTAMLCSWMIGEDYEPKSKHGFMGKKWDAFVPQPSIWRECLRVLKPGAYLLAFASTRTQYLMALGLRVAGFEIRDLIAWVYGSGFPKHKSALKPAFEPITLARKPAPKATPLNIEACMVGDEVLPEMVAGQAKLGTFERGHMVTPQRTGRYPANLIHDGSDEVLEVFPDSKGSGGSVPNVKVTGYGAGYDYRGGERTPVDCGTGSVARFFYCAKASKKDREEGLDNFQHQTVARVGALRDGGRPSEPRINTHPTVKPTALMQYLCRLITPPGGLIVDPFAGSGSTGKAAKREGFQFVGFELDAQYVAIANARIDAA